MTAFRNFAAALLLLLTAGNAFAQSQSPDVRPHPSNLSFNALKLSSPLGTFSGGTGGRSFTAHGVMLGEGAAGLSVSGPGTSGQCFTSNGSSADPTFQPCGAGGGVTGVTGTAPIVSSGGTAPAISCATCAIGPGAATTHALASWNGTGGLTLESLTTQFSVSATNLTAGSTGVLDLSGASVTAGLKIPAAAGAAPTADDFIAFNNTNHTHVWGSNGTTIVGAAAATGTGTATTCSNQFVTAVSSLVAPTCTSDVLASAQHANQGTTTTVLHGAAAGNPAWGAVVLSTDVSGQLPIGSVGSAGLTGTSPVAISAGGAISCATCVVASAPGAGLAHFAGSTQTVTSSAVTPSDATGNTTGSGNFVLASGATLSAPNLGTPASLNLANATGLPNASLAATPTTLCTTSCTISGLRGYVSCQNACAVTLPTPAAGVEYCIYNDDNIATVITIAALTSIQFENTSRLSFKTANTSIVSGGAAADLICFVGKDSTHYWTLSFNGNWI